MKLKNILFLLLIVSIAVAIAGCSSDNNGNGVQQVKESSDPHTAPQIQGSPVKEVTPVMMMNNSTGMMNNSTGMMNNTTGIMGNRMMY
jgi:hypothetical protein